MHAIEPVGRVDDSLYSSIVEALDHGRDGYPRWIEVQVQSDRRLTERVIGAAEERGYIPVSIERYWSQTTVKRNDVGARTLLLSGEGDDRWRAHAALLDAAARSPRPHILLTFARPARGPLVVREARVAPYGIASRPIGASPDVRRLIERAAIASRFVQNGRHAAAERLLREVGAALARRLAHRDACGVMLLLARLLIDRGRMQAACDVCNEAAQLGQSGGDDVLVVEARLCQAEARMGDAALVEAEALCQAVLAARTLPSTLQMRGRTLLLMSLLWQGRVQDLPEPSIDAAACDEPHVLAAAYAAAVRAQLTHGKIFEAGQVAGRLQTLADGDTDPRIRVAALGADLAVLAAAGDLTRAEHALTALIVTARRARLPLCAEFARLDWLDALRRAKREDGIARQLKRLQRVSRCAPNLLRREIARFESGGSRGATQRQAPVSAGASTLCTALVRLAQDDDDDTGAVTRLLQRLSTELHPARIDLVTADGGPPTVTCHIGDGLPTRVGSRVLDTVQTIGPERQRGGCEMGVPVRLGSHVIGGLVCRWTIDASVPAPAAELMELTAAVLAPRLEAWLTAKRDEAKASLAVPELIGTSSTMAEVRKAIARAAAAPFAVLIEGESGVGKELAARAIHHLSARRERRFCDINCAALPDELLESELFGHTRGAFSGAVADRGGLFEEADGGTLLLDEVADLSSRAQAKLLRAIQQQEVRRLGETFSRKIDVRIVAAANRDMRAEAAAGRFRQDLLYRLDVVRITIPPLRERPDDVAVLAAHCWAAAAMRIGTRAQLSPAVVRELSRYHWPGNVRELQNVLASLAVAAPRTGWVKPSHLPPVMGAGAALSPQLAEARAQFERRFIELALARAGGNRARAARSLGLSRQGLLKTLARLRIDRPAAGDQC
jgi:two-component system NtrC family response regulator